MRAVDRITVCLYVALAVLPLVALKAGWRDHEIYGRLPPAAYPERSFDAIRSEEFQAAYTAWFESRLGFKGYSIATDNALLYHLFRDTKPGSAVKLGLDGVLFNDEDTAYYNKYGRDLPDPYRVWLLADRIAEAQRKLAAQHRAFVPVIIPAKTTIYRNEIAPAWKRHLSSPRPVDGAVYAAMKRALDDRHVRYVDVRDMFLHSQEPRDLLWAQDARHWTSYGACIAMQQAAAIYVEISGKPFRYDCTFKRRWEPTARHDDFDLWRLLNMWRPPKPPNKIVPVLTRPAPASDTRPNLLLVGTSFCWTWLRDASASGAFGTMHMDYYNKLLVSWPDDVHTAVNAHDAAWHAAFDNKDLIVLDLFESYLLAPNTYVDEVLADLAPELDPIDEATAPTTGAAIREVHDLGVTNGEHYMELYGDFPEPTTPYQAAVTCDGVRKNATVYYQNPDASQLNVRFADPGLGACHDGRLDGVQCTIRVVQGTTRGAPLLGPRRVCPAPQGQSGLDGDGRCTHTCGSSP